MANPVAAPSLTRTYEECWVYATTSGTVYSTPSYPEATGASCYKIFPTGGGVEMSPVPPSEVAESIFPTQTQATATPSPSSSSVNIVGPVVGSVIGILAITIPVMWYIHHRRQRRKRELEKHEWAMKPGKWKFKNITESSGGVVQKETA